MAYNDGKQDKLTVEDLHKTTHYITPGQDAFLKRKVAELRRKAPAGRQDEITESTVLQGLINLWMALDQDEKNKA